MNPSLTELLENLKPGLLWVSSEGVVRYANTTARERTGLASGRRVLHAELNRAIGAAAVARVPREVSVSSLAAGPDEGERAPLACRVIPGLERDDAFVFIAADQQLDDGSAYETLMHALRVDLREPLRAAQAALAVARDAGSAGDGREGEALLDGIQDLLHVAERLVDLGRLWDRGSALADDRIELWPLLQQVWGEVEPVALRRDIEVRFSSQADTQELATLYGSARWIRRVFVECIEGAVRGAEPGTAVDIEHHQVGSRVRIVFRNCGLFERHGDAPVQGREAIGERLCRQVLGMHGGRLEEMHQGGQRHLVIELPTGAPHQTDQAALGLAQAQHYARDLAALMSRARRTARRQSAEAY